MTFLEKIQSMKPSEIIMAMVNGLKNEHVKLFMGSYGIVLDKNICYGCAATNTICEISGKVFNHENIDSPDKRSKFIEMNFVKFVWFENAIDSLRRGMVEKFTNNLTLLLDNPHILPDDLIQYDLPYLLDDYLWEELNEYEKYANFLKEKGY